MAIMNLLVSVCASLVLFGLNTCLETPTYDVIAKYDTYEERSYPSTTWVSTTDENPENIKGMFLRLFYYMQGANSGGRKIDMTAPMLRHNQADGNVTLLLYLPSTLQNMPPDPTDVAVNITELPARHYVVWQFGGFATDEIWMQELEKLKEVVKEDGNVTLDEYFAASYSGFHDVIDRRNEIWLIRDPEEVQE